MLHPCIFATASWPMALDTGVRGCIQYTKPFSHVCNSPEQNTSSHHYGSCLFQMYWVTMKCKCITTYTSKTKMEPYFEAVAQPSLSVSVTQDIDSWLASLLHMYACNTILVSTQIEGKHITIYWENTRIHILEIEIWATCSLHITMF